MTAPFISLCIWGVYADCHGVNRTCMITFEFHSLGVVPRVALTNPAPPPARSAGPPPLYLFWWSAGCPSDWATRSCTSVACCYTFVTFPLHLLHFPSTLLHSNYTL